MTTIALIKEQILWVDKWTINMVINIQDNLWNETPAIIESNINWQMGHILVSKYFHGIASVWEKNESITNELPLSEYQKFYSYGSDPKDNFERRPDKETLLSHFDTLNNFLKDRLDSLVADELPSATEMPNPVAKTKFKALMFCFKHQMYHNGQIGILRRILAQHNTKKSDASTSSARQASTTSSGGTS